MIKTDDTTVLKILTKRGNQLQDQGTLNNTKFQAALMDTQCHTR